MQTDDEQRARFAAMFDDLAPRVFAYARRRCDSGTAEDVVSETFLVAWRRRWDVPEPSLAWLFVVARNTIANGRRREIRQERVADTVARLDRLAGTAGPADDLVLEREAVVTALAGLTDLERESVLLVAWDGLTNREAARVAGCSVRAFEVRLSRARARLARELPADTPRPALRKVT